MNLRTCGVALIWACSGGGVVADDFTFDVPRDDRWHYPFNADTGSRPVASLFSSVGNVTFDGLNDRDAVMVIVWDTSGQVAPGMPAESYNVESVRVTVTHDVSAEWPVDLTVDEWFTFDVNNNGIMDGVEQPDGDCGRPIELFGAGFGPGFALDFSPQSWNEFSSFQGGDAGCDTLPGECTPLPRDPFPFVYQENVGAMVHVEDSVRGFQNEGLAVPLCADATCPFTPTAWSIGVPEEFLTAPAPLCGSVSTTDRFDIIFDIDLTLADGRVREYFQTGLSRGLVAVIITSLKETQIMASGNPVLITKEGDLPGDKPPQLALTLGCSPTADVDGVDGVNALDLAALVDCMNGPGRDPLPPAPLTIDDCLCAFDFDLDGDIDARDAAEVQLRFGSGS